MATYNCVKCGEDITEAVERAKIFDPLVAQRTAITVGSGSGAARGGHWKVVVSCSKGDQNTVEGDD